MGKTSSEIYAMASAGKIGFSELQKAIETGMGGAAQTMGQTFGGALSNMKASFSRLGQTIMEPLQTGLTPIMGIVTGLIDSITSGATDRSETQIAQLGIHLQTMIGSFIKTLDPILRNAIPIIAQVITAVAQTLPMLITQLLPVIVNSVLMIIQSITQMLPTIIQAIAQMLPQIITMLSEMLPQILQAIISAIPVIAQALQENLPTLIPIIVQGIIDCMQVFNDNMDLFLKAGIQIIIGLIKGLINSIPLILKNLGTIIKFMLNFFTASKLLKAGTKLIKGIGTGLIKGIPALIKNLPSIIKNMLSWFKTNGVSSFKNIGGMLIKGLWNGIKNLGKWVLDKIAGLGKSILKGVKGIFGIKSPSREFAWIGKMNILGLEQGMESMQGELQSTFDSMFDLSPSLYGSTSSNLSPSISVYNNVNVEQDPLGQMVKKVKTFSGGAKNDYNYGM